MTRRCSTCEHLPLCTEAAEQQQIDDYSCRDWAPAPAEELEARDQLVQAFGLAALRFTLARHELSAQRRRR